MLFALVTGVLAGALLPVQTAVNTRLSQRVGAVLPASLCSFAVGTLALGVAALVTSTRVPWVATATHQPAWIWLGGLFGLIFLSLNIVLLPRIGASATVILPVVGQILGGIVIDMGGLFGTAHHRLTVLRVVGAVLVLVGAALVNLFGRSRSAQPAGGASGGGVRILWVVGVISGALGAAQTAINGRLGEAMGSPLASALVSFSIGTAGLVVIVVATRPSIHVSRPMPPWLFVGGLLGAALILANAANAPVLGTSLTVSVVLLGQVAAGLLIDHRGLLGVSRRPVGFGRLIGAVIVLAGVALVRLG